MPGAVEGGSSKRKRTKTGQVPRKRSRSDSGEDDEESQSRIFLLETAILESKKNYNNITTLIAIAQNYAEEGESALAAAVSLCRVFVRLLASGKLVKRKGSSEKDAVVVQWLRERFTEYKSAILSMLLHTDSALTALTLSMRLLKAESQHLNEMEDYDFPKLFFSQVVDALVQNEVDSSVRKEFLEKFVDEYDDIRFYTFKALKYAVLTQPDALNLLISS